jgi:hypothetical protein
MRRFVFAAGLTAVAAGPAAACINDSELPGREREFRSQYGIDAPPGESGLAADRYAWAAGTAVAVGGVLAAAAVARVVRTPVG